MENDYITKTGSGQTQGKLKQGSVFVSQGYSVWSMENFEYFDPRRAFGKAAGGKPPPGYFIVVQSRSGERYRLSPSIFVVLCPEPVLATGRLSKGN
jgi:hypothetical protein